MEKIKTLLEEQLNQFLAKQPLFFSRKGKDHYSLTGCYCVKKKYQGYIVNMCYPVHIQIPFSFPTNIPIVKFEKKLIPVGFGHINNDGSLCLETPLNILDLLSEENSLCPLCTFFDVYLDNFFISMEYFSKYKKFPFGERSHGLPGEYEYFQERQQFLDQMKTNVKS